MRTFLIIVLAVFFSLNIFAQELNEEYAVKAAVENLFALSNKDNFKRGAVFMAYTGNDDSRNLKDSYKYNDMKEVSKVKRISKKIKAFIEISDEYDFGEFTREQKANTTIYAIEVIFKSGNQELKTVFSFVLVNNNYLLADLN